MSILLVLGFLFILLFLLKKQTFIRFVGTDTFLVQKLSNLKWFQNEWLSGLFLFLLNALLFSLAVSAIFVSGLLMIPLLHLVIMFAATLVSIYFWIVVHHAGNKGKKERLIMSIVGSSVYFFLLLIFVYMLVTLEPGTPENDTFMAAVGLMFAIFVSFVAWVTCFFITGLSKKQFKN